MKRPLQFILSETYESWSPEDVEIGETDDKGFNFEDVAYDYDELKDLLERDGFTNLSQSHVTPETGSLWISTDPEQDFATGEETIKSLHCAKVLDGEDKELKPAQAARAWNKILCEATRMKMQPRQQPEGPSMS